MSGFLGDGRGWGTQVDGMHVCTYAHGRPVSARQAKKVCLIGLAPPVLGKDVPVCKDLSCIVLTIW